MQDTIFVSQADANRKGNEKQRPPRKCFICRNLLLTGHFLLADHQFWGNKSSRIVDNFHYVRASLFRQLRGLEDGTYFLKISELFFILQGIILRKQGSAKAPNWDPFLIVLIICAIGEIFH